MARTGTILAMGGGGFSMMTENLLLDDYLLSLATRRRGAGDLPKVCFVGTASGDAEAYVDRFAEAFVGRAETSSLSLFHLAELAEQGQEVDLRAHVLAQDVIYVGGGSTANLLALWRLHGLDEIFAEAAADGIVLAGISAGMNCWFEASVTDSFGPLAALPDGLGFLPGSACPHYDGEAERRPAFHRLLEAGRIPGGYAADDGAALHFVDEALAEVVISKPTAAAYRLSLVDGAAVESLLPARVL